MAKNENKQVEISKENQKVSEKGGSNKRQSQKNTYLIKNTSGQDLTVCGVRLNPFERLKVELPSISNHLKRLSERGLIEITEVDGG